MILALKRIISPAEGKPRASGDDPCWLRQLTMGSE